MQKLSLYVEYGSLFLSKLNFLVSSYPLTTDFSALLLLKSFRAAQH